MFFKRIRPLRQDFSMHDVEDMVRHLASRPGAELGAMARRLRSLACEVERPRRDVRSTRSRQAHLDELQRAGFPVPPKGEPKG